MLSGKTFALKDVFDVKGHTASAGNPYWLHTHEQASDHAEAVKMMLNDLVERKIISSRKFANNQSSS